jgi:hypothetical protein
MHSGGIDVPTTLFTNSHRVSPFYESSHKNNLDEEVFIE